LRRDVSTWSEGCQAVSGAGYRNHAGDIVDCTDHVAINDGAVADPAGRRTRGAYDVLSDLIVALSSDMPNPGVVRYTLLHGPDLGLDPVMAKRMSDLCADPWRRVTDKERSTREVRMLGFSEFGRRMNGVSLSTRLARYGREIPAFRPRARRRARRGARPGAAAFPERIAKSGWRRGDARCCISASRAPGRSTTPPPARGCRTGFRGPIAAASGSLRQGEGRRKATRR